MVDARSPKGSEREDPIGPVSGGGHGGESVPSPDPTRLTTQLVDRAISAFREVMETRLNALAVAVELAAEKTDAVPEEQAKARRDLYERLKQECDANVTLAVEKIDRLRESYLEKFQGIDTRFQERDERTAQAAQESRISLDAALAAAKEAVSEQNAANAKAIAKSEDATQKQIDSNKTLMDTSLKSLQDQIAVLREDRAAAAGKSTGLNAGWGYLVGAAGFVATLVALAIMFRP